MYVYIFKGDTIDIFQLDLLLCFLFLNGAERNNGASLCKVSSSSHVTVRSFKRKKSICTLF
jgi:hypothetical protein